MQTITTKTAKKRPNHTNIRADTIIGSKYRIMRKFASGSFGDIYVGKCIQSGLEVAIKVEDVNTRYRQLVFEAKIYRLLTGGVGIPTVYYHGQQENYTTLVMDLLGPSLEELFNFCARLFTMKTVLMLVDQMIVRLEFLHLKCVLHRDIKPDNFLMGVGSSSKILFLIDFGLSKKFKDPTTRVHIPYREDKNLTGTARFSSVNAHLGFEQSRRDDLESLGYVMMYFNRGSLPWQGLQASNSKQKHEKIAELKLSTPVEILCKDFPGEFTAYFNYCRDLRFDQQPDYKYIRRMFRTLLRTMRHKFDLIYDWNVLKEKNRKGQINPAIVMGKTEQTDGCDDKETFLGDIVLD